MDDFGDDLLLQIFQRILCYKSLTLCKCVSKHWLSLIPPPNINRLPWTFISRVTDDTSDDDKKKLPSYANIVCMEEEHENIFNSGMLTSPNVLSEKVDGIASTCRDLILWHGTNKSRKMVLYLCNPLSKQWFPIPDIPQSRSGFLVAGFVFKSEQDDNSFGKFRVVLVSRSQAGTNGIRLNLHMYCSEIGQWSDLRIKYPTRFHYLRTGGTWFRIQGVASNGMIHLEKWRFGRFIAFDPFKVSLSNNPSSLAKGKKYTDITDLCHFIYTPKMMGQQEILGGKLAESQNKVVCIWIRVVKGYRKKVQVWELKDYNSGGIWETIHEVNFDQMVSMDISINDFLSRFCSLDGILSTCSTNLISVDSNDNDIIYMLLNDDLTYKLVSCHLPSKTMTFIRTMTFEAPSEAYQFCNPLGQCVFTFPLKPTPIPLQH